jgi:hypothetical protein
MRAAAVIVGFLFSILILITGGTIAPILGGLGLIASLALCVHRRAGFVLMLAPAVLAVIAAFTNGPGFLFYAVIYGLLALMARQSLRRHERNEARAERMDRYVRHQLGE